MFFTERQTSNGSESFENRYSYTNNSTFNGISNFSQSFIASNTNLNNVDAELLATDPPFEVNIPYTVLEILVAIIAIVGNAMVICVFHRERRLRRRTNYYIVSLALADLLVGLLGVPFAILASGIV